MRSNVRFAALLSLVFALLATPLLAEVVVEVRGPGIPAHQPDDVPPKALGGSSAKVLPLYRTQVGDGADETTIFAVRNNSADPLAVNFTYYESEDGVSVLAEQVELAGFATRSENMQLLPGLPFDDNNVTSGYLVVEPLGVALPDNVITGDYFRADTVGKLANGSLMVPAGDSDCQAWAHRLLSGAAFSGGTRVSVLVVNPPASGPVLEGNVYSEAGELVAVVSVSSDDTAFEFTDLELDLPVSFGSVDWFFQGESSGIISTTFTASGLRSVGMDASCIDAVNGDPVPPGSEVFELDGEFLRCRGCANWQYDMPFGGSRTFSKVVLDFDVFVNVWDPANSNGFHCLFWLNNGPKWQDMMGYLNSKGTQGRMTFQVNGPLGSPIGVEARINKGLSQGQKYSVHYEYDTVQDSAWYEIRNTSGELVVTQTISLPPSTGPVETSKMFIQFGHQRGEVESETPGWVWSDFRAVFVP